MRKFIINFFLNLLFGSLFFKFKEHDCNRYTCELVKKKKTYVQCTYNLYNVNYNDKVKKLLCGYKSCNRRRKTKEY